MTFQKPDQATHFAIHQMKVKLGLPCQCHMHNRPEAPSTRIRIFLKTHLFLSVLGSRPHGDGVFSHRKRSFSKTLSREDLFENAVFMLSCGRVKTELSKTLTSRHRFTTYQSMRTDLWGQQKGILIVCFLLSKFEQRSLNVAASSCGRGYFRKRSSCGRKSF